MTPGAAGAIFLADIHLDDLARACDPVPVPAGYASALGTFWRQGIPLNTRPLPVMDQRISPTSLRDAVATHAAEPLLRQSLVNSLLTRGLGEADTLDDLLAVPQVTFDGPWPSATAAVCTRDRPDDLRRCLDALLQVDYPALSLLVVDNAPADAAVQSLLHERYPQVRYVCEPRPGLDWARNRAILETATELIAFTDDDAVPDRGWLRALLAPLAADAQVAASAGLVLPFELETEAQQLFERHGGLGRGYTRRWTRVPHGTKTAHAGNPTTHGTGANMAFRRSLFDAIGGFDPALDAGTRSAAGGDTEMFFRVLKTGHTLAYEPGAVVRHRHRRDRAAIQSQLRSWLIGVHAAITRLATVFPDERRPLMAFAARLLLLYYPRRVAGAALGSSLDTGLVLSELSGALRGAGRYAGARVEAEQIAARFADLPRLADLVDSPTPIAPAQAARRVIVDIHQPLPRVLPGPDDAARVTVTVAQERRRLGEVQLVSGGAPIGRLQLAEAIVSAHATSLFDAGKYRDRLRTVLASGQA